MHDKDYDDWDAEDFENEVDNYAERFDEDAYDRRMAQVEEDARREAAEEREQERYAEEEQEDWRDRNDKLSVTLSKDIDIVPF